MWFDGIRRRASYIAPVVALLVAILVAPVSRPFAQGTGTDQQLDLIQQRTSRLRELESKGTITHTFMRRDALRDHYETMFFQENPVEDIETSQHLLEVLGYIDPSINIVDILLTVLGEEVLGFYDRDEKTIYVIADPTRDQLRPGDTVTMAHEFTHALQDEHFDLEKGFADRKDNNDRTLAFQALVEGDAVLLQSLYSLRFLSDSERSSAYNSPEAQSSAHAVDSAPLILQRELYFPYEDGPSFL